MDWNTTIYIGNLIALILQIAFFVGIIFGIRAIWKAIKGTSTKNNNGNKDQKPPWEG